MQLGDLLIRIGADVATFEALKSTLHEGADAVKEFAEKTESMAIILEANITRPLEQAAEKLVEFAEDFKTASNAIVIGTGAMGDQLAGLRSSFDNVFGNVAQTAGDVGAAMAQLATRLDLSGPPLEELTTKLSELSNITGQSIIPLAQSAATIFKQWNVATEDQAATLDHLMQVAMASGASFSTITDLVTRVGPAFREMGIGLEDTANLIGNLEKAGVNVEPTLIAMQRALLNMSKAGLKDPLEGLQLLIDKIQNASSEGQAFQIGATAFGRGATTIVEAIRSGKFSLDDFAGSLQLSDRSIEGTAEEMKTLGQRFQELKNELELALKPIAESLVEFLETALEAAKPLIEMIGNLAARFAELPAPVKEVVFGLAAFLAALGPILGLVAGVAAAMDALAVPGMALVGLLGGPQGLVVLAVAFGVALAAWAIYDAVTKAEKLITTLNSLYDAMDRGEVATKDQADQIAFLTSTLANHNKQLGAKQVVVPQTDAEDNILPNEAYIANLKKAVQGLDEFKGMQTTTSKVVKDANGVLTVQLSALGDTADAADKAGKHIKTFSADAIGAYDKLMAKYSAYKQAQEELKKLHEAIGAKSLPMLQLQIADLKRQVYTPTATDADNQMAAYYAEIVKLNRASNIQTSDETLTALADLQAKLKIAGMDTQQAFSLLGVTSTADINRQVEEVQAAQKRILASSIATNDDRTRATIAALDKEIAAWRTSGQSIANSVIDTAARIKAAWQAAHMDIGQAAQILGVQSEEQVNDALAVQEAALEKIVGAVATGERTQLDADNAEIASLQKKAAAFQAIGKQMSDDEVARLKELVAARNEASMTTEQAFSLIGLPSPQDLQIQIDAVTTAYSKIIGAVQDNEALANQVRAAELSRMVQIYRAAGQAVTDDMIAEWKARSAAAQIAALDVDQAFKILNTASTADATHQIELLQAAFDKIANDVHSSAADVQNALIGKLQGTIDALRKSGQAASDEMVHQLEDLKQRALLATLNIADAFKALGVTSTEAILNNFKVAAAALEKIQSDQKSSAYDLLQAQLKYNDDAFQMEVATGQKTDELRNAQNKLAKQRLQELLNDTQNIYSQFLGVIETAYGSLQQSLGDVITGAKSVGQAFLDLGKSVEKALVDFVIKNLLLTQDNLRKIESSLLSFFQDFMGISGGGGGGGGIGGLIPGLPGTGGGGGSGGGGGGGGAPAAGSGLGGIFSIVGAVSSIVNGIISFFQNARMEGTLNAIEQHTKVMAIAIAGFAEPWGTVADGTPTMLFILRAIADHAGNLESYAWGTLQADWMALFDKLDAITALLTKGIRISGAADQAQTMAAHAIVVAAAQLGDAVTSYSSAYPTFTAEMGQLLADSANQIQQVAFGAVQVGDAVIPVGLAATNLGAAAAQQIAAANTLQDVALNLTTASTALVNGAMGAVTMIEKVAAVVAVSAGPGPTTTFTPISFGPVAPAAVGAGGPGPTNSGGLGGAAFVASYQPYVTGQPPAQVNVTMDMSGAIISSARAADELLTAAVDKLRGVLKP